MRVLLIHQNFPGQFKHVASAWSRRPGWQLVGIGRDTAPGMKDLERSGSLRLLRYRPPRLTKAEQHPYLRRMEDAVRHGQAVAGLLRQLKAEGFAPDLILAHPGWGETLYAKDVFSNARLVHYAEWYYNTAGADLGFDPEFPASADAQARIRTWNALHLLNLEQCDAAISPTRWQKQQQPKAYRHKISVVHEGIDTELLAPDPCARVALPDGRELAMGDPVLTYVARNLEPYRGFHQFMRALPEIQRQNPRCHALIVGGDAVSYGRRPEPRQDGTTTWRQRMLAEVGQRLDPLRTHFLGRISYEQYRRVLQVSAAHVYLTYPFVLSWSLLEAMACGCNVIASDTAPVREAIQHGREGTLTPFFDNAALAQRVLASLATPADHSLRHAARARVVAEYTWQRGLLATEAACGIAADRAGSISADAHPCATPA